MKPRKAYQTLENRNNPDKIEEQGPFLCSHKNAWLGKGYYFGILLLKMHIGGDKKVLVIKTDMSFVSLLLN